MSHCACPPRPLARTGRLAALTAAAVLGVLIPLGTIEVMWSTASVQTAGHSSRPTGAPPVAVPLSP